MGDRRGSLNYMVFPERMEGEKEIDKETGKKARIKSGVLEEKPIGL